MSFRQYLLKFAVASIAVFTLSNAAQAKFCKKYKQVQSNAGACGNCFIDVSSIGGKGHYYAIVASNGWIAEARSTHGDTSLASGTGKWKSNVGHAFAGTKFEIDLEQQGSQLSMTMDGNVNGQRQIIRAKFQCIQR